MASGKNGGDSIGESASGTLQQTEEVLQVPTDGPHSGGVLQREEDVPHVRKHRALAEGVHGYASTATRKATQYGNAT